jgi:hypothetical protein
MGTIEGVRTRKYHSFYSGIAGRSETHFLADLDLKFRGQDLWPHRYGPQSSPVVFPDPLRAATAFAYEPLKGLPRWRWTFADGRLSFWIEPGVQGGMRLNWKWQTARRGKPAAQADLGRCARFTPWAESSGSSALKRAPGSRKSSAKTA